MVVESMEPLARLTRDLRNAAVTLTDREARYLVDLYYMVQEDRKRSGSQVRSMGEDEPHQLLSWVFGSMETLEHDIQRALDRYGDATTQGLWAKSICGIGPVITAGLLANIDITKAPTVGHIWRFAGLDPTVKWEKGKKRPWNASLKVLCWKVGESFVKVSNNEKDVYGHIWAARKELEEQRNAAGDFRDQAAAVLAAKKIGHDTEAYKHYSQGLLPPAHIHARAKRYAVKLFLASLHEVWYFRQYGVLPPKPYALEHMGHVHWFMAPNADLVPGLREAQEAARQGFVRRVLPETGEEP